MLAQAVFIPVAALAEGLRWAWPVALISVAVAVPAVPALLALCFQRGPGAPRRLRCSPEGELWLDTAGGITEQVRLLGPSVVAGPWLLLLLRGPRQMHPVLIECAALPADRAAALGRALARLRAAGNGTSPAALPSAASALLDPPRRLS